MQTIDIDRAGAWRWYAPILPAGATVLGTVTRRGSIGALVFFEATRIYSQLNGRVLTSLPQREVLHLLARA